MPLELIQIVLSFNDEQKVIEKRHQLNQEFRNYFYPDFFEDL